MRPFALVGLLLAAPAAASSVTCITKSGKTYHEPDTLSALVACQRKKLDQKTQNYAAKNHFQPSDTIVDSWQDAQRAEVRGYLKRHPDRASLDFDKNASAKDDAVAAQSDGQKSLDPKQAKSVEDLKESLQKMSDGGKQGVTPDMAQKINDYLQQNQGSVSPDMQNLLNSVQKDGGNLSADTINQLKDASQAAQQNGLNLNVDQKTQDFLNSPKDPPSSQPPNSN
jgi:hypothetical protein